MTPTDEAVLPPQGRLVRWLALGAAVVVAALVVLLAFSDSGTDRSNRAALVGQVAPPISGVDVDGEPFDLDDLRGRWVVVNFFATWCPPCIVEHPELVAFSERHADGDAVVVSIAFDDSADAVARFFATEGGDWPVLARDTGRFAIDYGVVRVPESYLVDPFGVVQAKFTGGVTLAGLEETIDTLTGSGAGATP